MPPLIILLSLGGTEPYILSYTDARKWSVGLTVAARLEGREGRDDCSANADHRPSRSQTHHHLCHARSSHLSASNIFLFCSYFVFRRDSYSLSSKPFGTRNSQTQVEKSRSTNYSFADNATRQLLSLGFSI